VEQFVGKMTLKDLWDIKEERELALACVNMFLDQYLKPSWAELYKLWNPARKMELFRWNDYLTARTYLTNPHTLWVTLRLKFVFDPRGCK